MTYKEWVRENGHLDRVIRPLLPPDEDLDKLTRKDVKDKFAAKIVRAAQDLGIELSEEELDGILDRIHTLPKLPDFHRSHYDLHC